MLNTISVNVTYKNEFSPFGLKMIRMTPACKNIGTKNLYTS
jgi:hypothetical protein